MISVSPENGQYKMDEVSYNFKEHKPSKQIYMTGNPVQPDLPGNTHKCTEYMSGVFIYMALVLAEGFRL